MARRDRSVERGVERGVGRAMRGNTQSVDDGDWDGVIMVFIGIVVALALVVGGLGWLDAHFGWHLREPVVNAIKGLFHGGDAKN